MNTKIFTYKGLNECKQINSGDGVMLRIFTFLLFSLILISSCATGGSKMESHDSGAALSSGIDESNFDTTVRPQDDIYQYVNGTWLANNDIPADKSSYSSFTELSDLSEERVKAIIDEAATGMGEQNPELKKIGDLYNSFMNTTLIEELGTTPLDAELAYIQKVSSYDDLIGLFVHYQKVGVKMPFGLFVDQDSKETTRYTLFATQRGLGLPDRDYYLKEDARFKNIRTKYVEHLRKVFTFAGQSDPETKAATVMKMETALAEPQWTPVQNRDRDKTYNKYYIDGLNDITPNFDWKALFAGLEVEETQDIIVRQPSYLEAFNDLWKKFTVEDWKIYFTWHLYDAFADQLPSDFVDANFDIYSKTLRGVEEIRPRWKRGVSAVNNILGEAVGKIYVEKHFKPEAKTRMKELVHNLEVALEERISELEWMGPETKKQALTKLAKFNSKIGYPDDWRDYSALEIKDDDLLGNYIRYNEFEHNRAMAKLSGPIDRKEWLMTPQTVNAYYNPPMNEIVFPAAILQPPFFNMEADDAVNYGGIGAVIGHEFSHGFDDQGRKSDGDGNLKEWWTEEDETKFNERAQVMVEQFNGFTPYDSVNVNGELTLGENIGDLAGLTIAFRAYNNSLNGKEAPIIDGFTGEQRFFMGWAQVWRRNVREKRARQLILIDPHSPGFYRVSGTLQNMPEFYEAFDVKEGDKLFVPVEERVKIW